MKSQRASLRIDCTGLIFAALTGTQALAHAGDHDLRDTNKPWMDFKHPTVRSEELCRVPSEGRFGSSGLASWIGLDPKRADAVFVLELERMLRESPPELTVSR